MNEEGGAKKGTTKGRGGRGMQKYTQTETHTQRHTETDRYRQTDTHSGKYLKAGSV
jgi:hypothetical protein